MTISLPPLVRFQRMVGRRGPDDCWKWRGALNRHGYGMFKLNRKMMLAHRVAYAFAFGSAPDGLCVCHSCDNRWCVNPTHLWLGTNDENVMDRVRKGRTVHTVFPGEMNASAKLSEDDVHRIRESKLSQAELASKNDVSQSTVSLIRSGKRWRHV